MYYAADLFCGAGGTSTGLINALLESGFNKNEIDLLAINHWAIAISTYSENYPFARNLCQNLDDVNPRMAVPGCYLDLLVASPECTHHSRARGGRPINDQSRASAWQVLRWAESLYIDNILIENVPEFMTWGPLDRSGNVVQNLKGKTFLSFIESLKSLDYTVEYRVLNAADYGDPTTRKRLFILARREKSVKWPEPAYGKVNQDMFRNVQQWRPAREIIDWSIKGESIFNRKKPLSVNTIKRIEAGLRRFSGLPFVIGQQSCSAPRSVDQPIPTVAGAGAISLVEPFIVAINHGSDSQRSYSLDNPMPTVTSADAWGLVEPFLVKYNSTGGPMSIDDPLDTVTGKDRFGLCIPTSDGQAIIDIRFRMLQPGELAAAMSFPKDYKFSGNREQKVKQIGNAVPCRLSKALCKTLIV